MDAFYHLVRIGGEKTIEIVSGQAIPDFSDALPLRHMNTGKEHQILFFVSRKPCVWHLSTILLTEGIRFGKGGHRYEASLFDTEPALPVWKCQLADICRSPVGFYADQFFKIEGLALGCELFRFGFGRLVSTFPERKWYDFARAC